MNYEQEYKKAFEAAKGLHDAGNALTKKQMEIVFPKLAESEDERIRKELIEQVGYLLPDNEEYDDEGRVLPTYHKRIERYRAYLEKQKPAEWSDEDEKMLSKIIKHFDWYDSDRFTAEDCKEAQDFLKSLRPQGSKDSLQTHWKPSEEQMEALAYAGKVLAPRATKAYEELESLREQLKKL